MTNKTANTPEDPLKYIVEVWKQTVDLQKHFNDLCLRIRTLGITIVTAIFGAVGLAEAKQFKVEPGWLFAAGLTGWLACWVLDRLWYHQLLRGAVQHGMSIEKLLEEQIAGIGLATKLSEVDDTWPHFSGHRRIDIFYLLITLVLVAFFITTLVMD